MTGLLRDRLWVVKLVIIASTIWSSVVLRDAAGRVHIGLRPAGHSRK
jgi:hypothetical protein